MLRFSPCCSSTSRCTMVSDCLLQWLPLQLAVVGSSFAAIVQSHPTPLLLVSPNLSPPACPAEFYPFSSMHTFPFDPAFRAQRLCRHMLNVVAGCSILADSHDVSLGWVGLGNGVGAGSRPVAVRRATSLQTQPTSCIFQRGPETSSQTPHKPVPDSLHPPGRSPRCPCWFRLARALTC